MKELAELEAEGDACCSFHDSKGGSWTGVIIRSSDNDSVWLDIGFDRSTANLKLRRFTAHCKDWTEQAVHENSVDMGSYKEFAERFIDEENNDLVVSIDIEEYDGPTCPVEFQHIPALSKILQSKITSDVTFKVEDTEFLRGPLSKVV